MQQQYSSSNIIEVMAWVGFLAHRKYPANQVPKSYSDRKILNIRTFAPNLHISYTATSLPLFRTFSAYIWALFLLMHGL